MKILKTFLILLFIVSCSDKKPEKQTTEFDKILGMENSETLNLIVSEFENGFLKRQYPNLDTKSAYTKFVTDVSVDKTKNFVEFSKKTKDLFYKSKLRLEIYCVIDSTWIEKNPWNDESLLVKGRTNCLNHDGTFENGLMEMPFNEKEISRDSIQKRYLKFVKTNYNGKYLKALNSISDKSEFLSSFVKDRVDFGIIPSEFIAKRLLAYNADMEDYYVRRIIAIELIN